MFASLVRNLHKHDCCDQFYVVLRAVAADKKEVYLLDSKLRYLLHFCIILVIRNLLMAAYCHHSLVRHHESGAELGQKALTVLTQHL